MASEFEGQPKEASVELTDNDAVRYHEPDGSVRWTTVLDAKLGSLRTPDRLIHGGRVFVVRYPGIVALDDATGEVLWKSCERAECLIAYGDLLLARNFDYEDSAKRWLVARRTSSGEVIWRTAIPMQQDPVRIARVGNVFIVRSGVITEGLSQVVDMQGRIVLDTPECIYSGYPASNSGDLILLTNKRIIRFRPSEKRAIWETREKEEAFRFFWPFWHSQSLPLRSGDLLVYGYGPISDSGIELRRLRIADGKVLWTARCASLRVAHSQYLQMVVLREVDNDLLVLSRGARDFFEVRDLSTGAQRRRWEFDIPLDTGASMRNDTTPQWE